MRDPSLHIKKSDLKKVLKNIVNPFDNGLDHDKLADMIFYQAKPYSVHSRTVTVTNDRIEKKAKKLVGASRLDADLLSQLIYARRKILKHRGISRIKPGGRDWEMVKEITAQALAFTNEFELTRKYGFTQYIDIGISKMQKFTLNKFPAMYEGICERYIALEEIKKDKDSEMTLEMYNGYCQRVLENTGIHEQLDKIPEKYVWFVRARQQAEDLNVSVNIYVKAQFEGLDFTKGKPHPVQMTGVKATDRVIRYCYKHDIKVTSR